MFFYRPLIIADPSLEEEECVQVSPLSFIFNLLEHQSSKDHTAPSNSKPSDISSSMTFLKQPAFWEIYKEAGIPVRLSFLDDQQPPTDNASSSSRSTSSSSTLLTLEDGRVLDVAHPFNGSQQTDPESGAPLHPTAADINKHTFLSAQHRAITIANAFREAFPTRIS